MSSKLCLLLRSSHQNTIYTSPVLHNIPNVPFMHLYQQRVLMYVFNILLYTTLQYKLIRQHILAYLSSHHQVLI